MATPEQIVELLQKMHEERAALIAVASTLDEATAERRPPEGDGEDGWSAKEQLSHLAEMDVSYRTLVERTFAGSRADAAGENPRKTVAYPLEDAHTGTVSQLLEEMAKQRERTSQMMAKLSGNDYDVTVSPAGFPQMTVIQWLRSYYRHDRMHSAQIQGRKSDYQPNFARGEPDQRRRR